MLATIVRASLALFAVFALYVAVAITPAYVSFLSGEAADHPTTSRMLVWLRSTAAVLGLAALAGAAWSRAYAVYTSAWFIFALPIVCVCYFAALKADLGLLNRLYIFLVHEDGLLEALSFAFFFISSLIGIGIVVRAFRSGFKLLGWFHLGLAGFLMFVALEEISYGQRLFHFSTPSELQNINRQKEFNFHNIRIIEWFTLAVGPLLVALYGAFGWAARLLLKLLPPRSMAIRHRLPLAFAPWHLATYFLPLAAFSLIAMFFQRTVTVWVSQDQELAEFFLSAGFFLFVSTIWFELRAGRVQEPDARESERFVGSPFGDVDPAHRENVRQTLDENRRPARRSGSRMT